MLIEQIRITKTRKSKIKVMTFKNLIHKNTEYLTENRSQTLRKSIIKK